MNLEQNLPRLIYLKLSVKIIEITKEKLCKECKIEEQKSFSTIICLHEISLKTEYPTYFQVDLENALEEIMKFACHYDIYNEILGWTGSRNKNNWLIPNINENGSSSVKGLVKNETLKNLKRFILLITEEVIHLKLVKSLIVKEKIIEKKDFGTKIIIEEKSNDSNWLEQSISLYHEDDLIIKEGDSLFFISFLEKESFNTYTGIAFIIPTDHNYPFYLCECFTYNYHLILDCYVELLINLKEQTIIQKELKINSYKTEFKNKLELKLKENNSNISTTELIEEMSEKRIELGLLKKM